MDTTANGGSTGAAAQGDERSLRPRLVRVVSGLLGLCATVCGVAAVAVPVNQLTQPGAELSVKLAITDPDRTAAAVRALAKVPDGTYLNTPLTTTFPFHISELPWHLRLLSELPASLHWLCLAIGSLLVLRILDSFVDGSPFDVRNPRRVTWLAAAVAVANLVPLVEVGTTQTVLRFAGATGSLLPSPTVEGPLLWALIGSVVLLGLAETFRSGGRLTRDVEGLV